MLFRSEKYFGGETDAIELGASAGVVSSHIISKFKDNHRRLIGVEANNSLTKTWYSNVARHNRVGIRATLLTQAIYYGGSSVHFQMSSNTTESRISESDFTTQTSLEVKSVSLSNLVKEHKILCYALFCDIEGAELQIFLNENSVLENCRQIFIELHNSNEGEITYSIDELNSLIQSKGFTLIDKHGPVCYYKRELCGE